MIGIEEDRNMHARREWKWMDGENEGLDHVPDGRESDAVRKVEENFRDGVMICVDRVIKTLGNTGRIAFYSCLLRRDMIEEDLAENPEELSTISKLLFGPAGEVLEKAVIREIGSRFGIEGEPASFSEAIRMARARAFSTAAEKYASFGMLD